MLQDHRYGASAPHGIWYHRNFLSCARNLTEACLVYRMEPENKNNEVKSDKKLKRWICLEERVTSHESVESVLGWWLLLLLANPDSLEKQNCSVLYCSVGSIILTAGETNITFSTAWHVMIVTWYGILTRNSAMAEGPRVSLSAEIL